MSQPEDPRPEGEPVTPKLPGPNPARYGRYVLVPVTAILIYITINTLVTKPNGSAGVTPGQRVPPFAAPLVLSTLEGDPDIAVHANEGSAGKVPACQLRKSSILNICQLYEGHPVVLALFLDSGSCAKVLGDMQALAPSFPSVRFAAVALGGSRDSLRRLIRSRQIGFPIGFDRKGSLLALYKVASCPQLTFVLPGGRARGKPLLSRPDPAVLRKRVAGLVAAAGAVR